MHHWQDALWHTTEQFEQAAELCLELESRFLDVFVAARLELFLHLIHLALQAGEEHAHRRVPVAVRREEGLLRREPC